MRSKVKKDFIAKYERNSETFSQGAGPLTSECEVVEMSLILKVAVGHTLNLREVFFSSTSWDSRVGRKEIIRLLMSDIRG